jgi:serine/threonine protein kinase
MRQIGGTGGGAQPGIIHRDLKPANIKVRPDGVVKVWIGWPAWPSGAADGPTITAAVMTSAGSSEQLHEPRAGEGQVVDQRADIWRSMRILRDADRRRTFSGETIPGTIAAVLEWGPTGAGCLHDANVIRPVLARCLRKTRNADGEMLPMCSSRSMVTDQLYA